MNLPLEPGRRCLIAPWSPHSHRGSLCTLLVFQGEGMALTTSGLEYSLDWWRIDIDGVGSILKCGDPACVGHNLGARATWLIPLPGDEEGKTMFDNEPAPPVKKPVHA